MPNNNNDDDDDEFEADLDQDEDDDKDLHEYVEDRHGNQDPFVGPEGSEGGYLTLDQRSPHDGVPDAHDAHDDDATEHILVLQNSTVTCYMTHTCQVLDILGGDELIIRTMYVR